MCQGICLTDYCQVDTKQESYLFKLNLKLPPNVGKLLPQINKHTLFKVSKNKKYIKDKILFDRRKQRKLLLKT